MASQWFNVNLEKIKKTLNKQKIYSITMTIITIITAISLFSLFVVGYVSNFLAFILILFIIYLRVIIWFAQSFCK